MTIQNKTEIKNRNNRMERFVKRSTDILVSVPCLVLSSPLFVIISLAIKWEDGLPIIYKQERIGLHGKPFNIYKFRSMKADAEKDGPNLLEIEGDTRLTHVGKFIRTHHLDELPQFWNVLKGDMSLVGTRPPTVDEYEKYSYHHKARLATKPGITGMWQVSGRSNITNFEDIVELDTEYITNWSLALDIQILIKTVKAVLKKEGAE